MAATARTAVSMVQRQPTMDADLLDQGLEMYNDREVFVEALRGELARLVRDSTAPGLPEYVEALRDAPSRTAQNDVLAALLAAGVDQDTRLLACTRAGIQANKVTLSKRTARGNAADSALELPTIRRVRGVPTRLFSLSQPATDLDELNAESERRGVPATYFVHTALHRIVNG